MPGRICFGLDQVERDRTSVVTVGSFDGLHVGHRSILGLLKSEAARIRGTSTVVTFEPHPQLVLRRPDQPPVLILTTIEEKIALFQEHHVERVVVIPFTRQFSQTSSESFVREILYGRIGLHTIVIGHDHGFGKNREGDVATLMRLGEELGFAVHELPPMEIKGVVISSTRIREALQNGDLERANQWLGSPYRFSGRIVSGSGRGKTIGFPTANVEPLHAHKLIPAGGVYAVRVFARQNWHGGMMNIGVRPTFDETVRTLEVHLFDFSQDLYGQTVEVHLQARLRPEKKFASVEELSQQLQQDRARSLALLAGT